MNLIMPDDGVTVSPNLDASECVSIYIIMLDEATSLPEYIYTSLVAIVYLVTSDGGVAVGSDPDASKVVGMDFVVDELAETVLMNVDAARLPMMDLAVYHGWICACFYLKSSYSIVVNVVCFKIALKNIKMLKYPLASSLVFNNLYIRSKY